MQKHKYYDVIVAWASGEQVQHLLHREHESVWTDFVAPLGVPAFNNNNLLWRIKPKTYTEKYRMALLNTPLGQEVVAVCLADYTLDSPAEHEVKGFVRWIGESVEVEFEK